MFVLVQRGRDIAREHCSKEAMVKRFPLVIAWFAVIAFDPAMAKGGTNMHEMASSRHEDEKPNFMNSIGFIGCGRGRYRDSRKCPHRCPGPAEFWYPQK